MTFTKGAKVADKRIPMQPCLHTCGIKNHQIRSRSISCSKVKIEIYGDTDYENLWPASKKLVIVRGTVECSNEKRLHGEESSKREDSVPTRRPPEHCHVKGSYEAHDISAALKVHEIK
ncbi:hypothetical protein Pint_34007 [Pistacia integerrima]|uniref:Uncharacterized protein n=1 Tax=Pistacia integerrima TaxID=434235 RepID=A0ACC0X5Z9_9ROSI|nr:hypothetical protein Pint_34007 [Pistacia integerrima]